MHVAQWLASSSWHGKQVEHASVDRIAKAKDARLLHDLRVDSEWLGIMVSLVLLTYYVHAGQIIKQKIRSHTSFSTSSTRDCTALPETEALELHMSTDTAVTKSELATSRPAVPPRRPLMPSCEPKRS